MKCPVCPTTNLIMTERQGVEIDYCPECRGVWLDRGNLTRLSNESTRKPLCRRPMAKRVVIARRSTSLSRRAMTIPLITITRGMVMDKANPTEEKIHAVGIV